MTTVATLAVNGDGPALEDQLLFHLYAGAAAIVVDEGLRPRDSVIVETFLRDGRVRLVAGSQMAAVAAELGADWVLPLGEGEFWWPRGHRYDEILGHVPAEFDVVQALVRPFLPTQAASFEPGTYRLSAAAYAHELGDNLRPQRRIAHRAGVEVKGRAEGVVPAALRPLRGWFPIEVLWFPASLAVPEADIERGVKEGIVQVDARLRDMLDALRRGEQPDFPRPTVVENAAYAVDAAVLGESDAVRLRTELDALEARLATVERATPVRLERKLRRLLRQDGRR